METIKVGKKICLEMKPISMSKTKRHKRILKLNFFDVDKIKSLKNINSVIATDKDYSYIDLIIKFCQVTFLRLNIYPKTIVPDKIIKKIKNGHIKCSIKKKHLFIDF